MKTKTQSFGKPLCRVIAAAAVMLLSFQTMAQSYFSYAYQGKELEYYITNDVPPAPFTVVVHHCDNLSGEVVIPSSVVF